MAKAQQKEQVSKARKKKAGILPERGASPGKAEQEAAERRELWQAEIKELRDCKFASIGQAVEAVVDKALEKYDCGLGKASDVRGFLIDTISTSPEVLTQLREVLHIEE